MRSFLLAAALLPLALQARADDTPEDRLRAALRQSVTEMRAAQDQAAQLQAQLTQAQTDLAAAKAKSDADEKKLADLAGTVKPDELKAMQAELDAAKTENTGLRQNLQAYQGKLQEAQDIARQKIGESQQAEHGLQSNYKALETCKDTNKKLIDVSEQVLNLWHDRSFIWVLRKSYEPLVGAAKVDLENIVQDYDDKIRDQEYVPPAMKK